jgi:uncharacterized protein YukE
MTGEAVSPFGDVVPRLIGSVPGLADVLDGASAAPVPSVGSRPARIAGPRAWSAPNASAHGQVAVHRDVLRGVATGMRSDLKDLDGAVSRLAGARHGSGVAIAGSAGLIAGWPTAVAFNGNASAALTGVMAASQQSGTAHEDTSSKLATSAAAYDQSETDNLRAARSVGTNLYGVTGLVASYGSGGKAAASPLGAQPSYPVKTHAVSAFSGAGMSAGTIMDILHGLSPGIVSAAGAAHTQIGNTLQAVAGRLAANARTLAQNWTGSAAQGAMGQFQQLHDHMVTLADQALQVGSVLTWLGGEVLPQFTSLPDPRVSATSLILGDAATGTVLAGPAGGVIGAGAGALDELDGAAQAAADRAAQQYIAKLSGYLVIANQSLPDTIGAPLPPSGGNGGGPGPAAPVTGGTGGGGSGATLRLTSVGVSGTPGKTSVGGKTSGTGGKSTTGTGNSTAPPSFGSPPSTGVTGSAGGVGTVAQPGNAAPPSLQGATLTSSPSAPPAGGASTFGSPSAPVGSGALTGGLPGPASFVPGANEPPAGPLAATLDDAAMPGLGQSGTGPVTEELPGSVAPEASGFITELDEPGLPGLSGAGGFGGTGSPVAGELIGGQAGPLNGEEGPLTGGEEGPLTGNSALTENGVLAGPGEAVSPEADGFGMMGSGGTARPDEQERIRDSWLNDDELWSSPANLVPPVIGE